MNATQKTRTCWDKFQYAKLADYIEPRIGSASLISIVEDAMLNIIPKEEYRTINSTIANLVVKRGREAKTELIAASKAMSQTPAPIIKMPVAPVAAAPKVVIITNNATGAKQVFLTSEYTVEQL